MRGIRPEPQDVIALIPPGGLPEGYADVAVLCAKAAGARLVALYVVDSAWFDLSAADWLSTGPSRAGFDSYMRETLAGEGKEAGEAFTQKAAGAGVEFRLETAEGEPGVLLARLVGELEPCFVLAVSGHPGLERFRPAGRVKMRWYNPPGRPPSGDRA